MKKIITLFCAVFFLVSCVPMGKMSFTPSTTDLKNSLYEIDLNFSSKAGNDLYNQMEIVINNKTSEDIEIVWDKTYYLYNGQTNGGFMFEGIVYSDRNNQKSNDIVFANSLYKKIIYPNNLVIMTDSSAMAAVLGAGSVYGAPKQWAHDTFKEGTHGIYLTMKIKDEILKEKIEYQARWIKN